ncbi:MAG: phage holin family protein [Cyanobacteriota bacterium]|nr:phage holin family protein [Cyanobacteria bacterium K_Offshore_surface_m2_239]MEB3157499.1 phage holin family protein [Cyanobacteriota bacterium]
MNLNGASRLSGLLTSVVDLHVRMAMQEANKDKRRLITGAVILGGGLSFLLLGVVMSQIALALWVRQTWRLTWLAVTLILGGIDLALSGVFLRVGGALLKQPLLPETLAGLRSTTRALTGRRPPPPG